MFTLFCLIWAAFKTLISECNVIGGSLLLGPCSKSVADFCGWNEGKETILSEIGPFYSQKILFPSGWQLKSDLFLNFQARARADGVPLGANKGVNGDCYAWMITNEVVPEVKAIYTNDQFPEIWQVVLEAAVYLLLIGQLRLILHFHWLILKLEHFQKARR